MNREWVLFNLREAQEEMTRAIANVEADQSYDRGELGVAVTHAYRQIEHSMECA